VGGRLVAPGICNRGVTGNIVRRILIATPPTGCAHLMPQERADRDEECDAHEKWRR
jgi:hypothetical protein